MQLLCKNEKDTENIAVQLAASLQPNDIVCLSGDLGSGKTLFARALIRAMAKNPDLDVPSPTFTLVQLYDTPKGVIWHFDLYRLKNAEEIYELGWEEALAGNITLVEWPEKLEYLAPEDRLDIIFSVPQNKADSTERLIAFQPQGSWQNRKRGLPSS